MTKKQVVATMGDYKLTNSRLQVFYWMQVYDLLDYYTEQYGDYAVYYLGLDMEQPLSDQIYREDTGMTWEQYFLEEAFFSWQRYQALADEAKKAGYQMPEDYQKALAEDYSSMEESAKQGGFDSVDAMLQAEMGSTVTYDDYHYYLEVYWLAYLYYLDVSSNLTFTDAELDAYFQENAEYLGQYGVTKDSGDLVDFRNILVKPVSSKDEEGNTVYTEQAWADCLAKAQEILKTWEESDKLEQTFAELANSKSEDSNSASNGGLYRYNAKNDLATVDVRHILIMPEGGKTDASGNVTYSEEEWEACRVAAQTLLDQYLAGEKTEDAFGALANEHSDDNNGNVTNGGLYTDVYTGEMVEAFDVWIFDSSRQPGDTGLVKTQFGYHIMYFVHREGPIDEWLFAEGREGGQVELIKTEEGYQIIYYVSDQPEWEAYAREGLQSQTEQEWMESCTDARPMDVRYWAVMFSELVVEE